MSASLFTSGFSLEKTLFVLLGIGVLAALDLTGRFHQKNYHYVFGCVLGTLLALTFLTVVQLLFSPAFPQNPYLIGLTIVLLVAAWQLLFGPWAVQVKATVLGTFLAWISLKMIGQQDAGQRIVTLIAMVCALVPAGFWCALFLPYHREQLSKVFLMFFAGMAATAPILFYDALVRHGSQLSFFYFRIVPESFNTSSETFVSGQLAGAPSVQTTLVTLFVSFLLVGLIEEGSKYWVLRHSGKKIFSSIDEVLELSIVVAIGFAFAENILNGAYFPSFVKEYLFSPQGPQIMKFIGNVAGRSVLTSMVHILSTGIAGYFLGRAIYAPFLLRAADEKKRSYPVCDGISSLLSLDRVMVFRWVSVTAGFCFAVLSHAFANFLVTFPDALPNHPQTIGDLVGAGPHSFLQFFSLLLLPSFFYVVGGFLLLTWLLEWRENRAERGMLMAEDAFISEA